jgi:Transposase DDE domain group 1
MLFACRTSCATMRANQVRLLLSTVAYVVLRALRQFGLAQTELAAAQADTLRLKLLKIGAVLRFSVRRVWVALSEAYPFRDVFVQVWENLHRLVVPAPRVVPTG